MGKVCAGYEQSRKRWLHQRSPACLIKSAHYPSSTFFFSIQVLEWFTWLWLLASTTVSPWPHRYRMIILPSIRIRVIFSCCCHILQFSSAKAIFRKLNNQSAPKMSIEHADKTFHYQINQVKAEFYCQVLTYSPRGYAISAWLIESFRESCALPFWTICNRSFLFSMEAELKKLRGRITLCKYLVRAWNFKTNRSASLIPTFKKQRNKFWIREITLPLKMWRVSWKTCIKLWVRKTRTLVFILNLLVANLDEVLQRGTALSDMQNKSSDLLGFSKKYREDAKKINARSK